MMNDQIKIDLLKIAADLTKVAIDNDAHAPHIPDVIVEKVFEHQLRVVTHWFKALEHV
jgi:hypothetical protein